MATPAQVRRERKQVLRLVQSELRQVDTIVEKNQRFIKRVLAVRKRFPDEEDAIVILTFLREMDKALEATIKQANNFSKIVKVF